MVDKICDKIMNRVRAKMPEVDDERAEVIRYGLELMIGEVPKFFIMLIISYILGIFKYFIISFFIICTYRFFSGGIHLKSHLGCVLGTTILYFGNIFISKIIYFPNIISKIIFSIIVLGFSFIMITLYAPADTENVPILRKKDRNIKKICSYIVVTFLTVISFFINNQIISNMCIIGILLQSITITKALYKIFNVKLGYLEYIKTEKNAM
ncbi:MAG: accessory gene regulator B family protein [Clostridia bacterium]|nr:accessory gene regulator B family protein [Clostridia bacterium]